MTYQLYYVVIVSIRLRTDFGDFGEYFKLKKKKKKKKKSTRIYTLSQFPRQNLIKKLSIILFAIFLTEGNEFSLHKKRIKTDVAASPSQRKKRFRKGFPIWNERVAAAVQSSKAAHYRWKRAGRPRDNSGLLKQKKEARKSMRRVPRMTLY